MFEPKLRELARSLAVLIRTQAEEADDAEEQADLQDDIEFPITIHCSGRLDVRAQPTPPSPFPYFTLPILEFPVPGFWVFAGACMCRQRGQTVEIKRIEFFH
jgi:hypothetical protein